MLSLLLSLLSLLLLLLWCLFCLCCWWYGFLEEVAAGQIELNNGAVLFATRTVLLTIGQVPVGPGSVLL